MARAATNLRSAALLGVASLVVAGCGGGDAEVPAATDPGAAAPAPGTTVGGDGTTPAIDPLTGQPVATDPAAAAGGGATASIPDLSGDDIGGGLGAVSSSPIFEAGAISPGDFEDQQEKREEDAESSISEQPTSPTTEPKAPAYSGAKIYVDGMVHDVSSNGLFPSENPVFRLLSVSANDIEIELVAGEFTTGGGTGTVLDKGELVSLVNASEQLTYRIKYLRPITESSSVVF
jgi:hypothetical protein